MCLCCACLAKNDVANIMLDFRSDCILYLEIIVFSEEKKRHFEGRKWLIYYRCTVSTNFMDADGHDFIE